jgi:hypothetical protein
MSGGDQAFVVTYVDARNTRCSVLAYSPSKANAMRFAEQAALTTHCRSALRSCGAEEAFYDPADGGEEPRGRPYLQWDDAVPDTYGTLDADDRPVNEIAAIVRRDGTGAAVGRFAVSVAELTVFDALAADSEADRIYASLRRPQGALAAEDVSDGTADARAAGSFSGSGGVRVAYDDGRDEELYGKRSDSPGPVPSAAEAAAHAAAAAAHAAMYAPPPKSDAAHKPS